MPVHQLDPYRVSDIREIDGKPNSQQARELLEAVARQVQPIMHRRQLTCPLLLEFFPTNARLYGLNVGGGGGSTSEIRLRLRRASQEADLMPFESVLGTMLHELTHNHVGPHNATFYKLLDELTKECDDLIARGISGTGAGFDAAPAGKVGGRFVGRANDVPVHRLRDLAKQAAETRLKKQAVMPVGPHTTGGDTSLRHLPPREAAAAATERRLRDNLWCPTEALGEEAAAGHDVIAALQAILNNARGGVAPAPPGQEQQQQPEQEQGEQRQRQQGQQPQRGQQAQQQQSGTDAPAASALGPRLPLRERVAAAVAGSSQGAGNGSNAAAAAAAAAIPLQPVSRVPCKPAAAQPAAEPPRQQQQQRQPQQPPQQQPQSQQQQQHPHGGAPRQQESNVVDLTLSSDDEGAVQPSAGKRLAAPSKRTAAEWACPACTLLNKPLALACEACLATRPVGWLG